MNRSQFAAWVWYAVWWCPCFVIGQLLFRYRYSGKNQIPLTGPVLLVSNHQSNLDPVLVGVACPRQLKYLARKGLFFFPFNYWISALGAVPIDQEGSALAGLRITLDLLKKDNAVLVFPEGSRSPDGKLHQMMSDAELTELVTAQIAAAFVDVRQELGMDPPNGKFPRLRDENSLLANHVETA